MSDFSPAAIETAEGKHHVEIPTYSRGGTRTASTIDSPLTYLNPGSAIDRDAAMAYEMQREEAESPTRRSLRRIKSTLWNFELGTHRPGT